MPQISFMEKYRKRIADDLLDRKLAGKGAVLIEGPKWCGKTTTAEQHAQSVVYIDDPEMSSQYKIQADIQPKALLQGETPRLIDEWQIVPSLWDSIRFEVDHRDGLGYFILTGSSVPVHNERINHSGTGRFGWLRMRPMSLFESGDSNGKVSLSKLFQEEGEIYAESNHSLRDIAYLICRGGWPKAVDMDTEYALDQAFDYCDAITKRDISKVDDVNRNPERVKRLMRSYARLQGAQSSYKTICDDLANNEVAVLDVDTIASYILSLKKMFVIEDVPAWNPNLRSKTAIRTSDTRYFTDPSIGTAILNLGPDALMDDLSSLGLFFETLCVRDLRTYAESMMGSLSHYRDSSGLECDAVIHLRNGLYGLIEIKLGGDSLIAEGVKTLTQLKSKIDTTKMKEPSFLMIVTATGKFAYRMKNGIYIVPIDCLRP